MSSTRRANKRARLARRAENDAMRDARREALFIILSRAQRGRPLTADEAAQLRVAVEAEIREGDTARLSERGQQRAMEEHRQRVEAADEAIRELEQRAERAEAEAEGYRAAEKYRQAAADTFAGRLDAIRQQTAEGLAEGFEELTKRAEKAEEHLAAYVDIFGPDAVDDFHAMQHRAKIAEARLDEEQKAHDDHRRILATALHAREDHDWSALIDWAAQAHEWASRAAVKADRKRAAEAEGRLARIRDMADAWESRLPATIRTATAAEAVRNAANGDYRPVMFGMAEAPADDVQPTAGTREFAELERARFERLYTRETVRADKAEQSRDRFEAAWQSARLRARRHVAEEQRIRGWLTHWADRARDAERLARAKVDSAERTTKTYEARLAEQCRRADTYRAAWHSARDRARKATRRGDIWKAKAYEIEQDRDRLAAELPLTAVPARRPEVITDRATIRNTLDEPEPGAPCPCNGVCHECDDSPCDACAPARP